MAGRYTSSRHQVCLETKDLSYIIAENYQPGTRTPIYSTLSAASPKDGLDYPLDADTIQDGDDRPASRNWPPMSSKDNERLRMEGFDTASPTYKGSSAKRQTVVPGRTQSRGSKPAKGKPLIESTAQTDDDSKWIHRDKLAQIESQELREISFRLGLPAHVESGTQVRPSNHDKRGSFHGSSTVQETGVGDAHSISVASPSGQQRPDSMVLESTASLLVTDSHTATSYWLSNPETDKTELPSSTPQAYLDALQPPRGDSHGQSSSSVKRTGQSSLGTQLALRKSLSQQKRSTARRSGETNRASMERQRPLHLAARPEGDAPWLAEMYKPDPRLPQEEQIIPTHAKRLAREKVEMYDMAPLSSRQPQSFLLEPDDPESDEAEKSGTRHSAVIAGKTSATHDPTLEKQISAGRSHIAGSNDLQDAVSPTHSEYTKSNEYIHLRTLNSPLEVDGQEWPLSSTRVDNSPPKPALNIRPGRDGDAGGFSRGSDRGSYQLTPVIRTKEEMEQRLGQQPGVGSRTSESETPKLALADTSHLKTTPRINKQTTSVPGRPIVSKFEDDKPEAAVKTKKKRRKRFLCF